MELKVTKNSCEVKNPNYNLDLRDIVFMGLKRVIKLKSLTHETNQTFLMDQNMLKKLDLQPKSHDDRHLRIYK